MIAAPVRIAAAVLAWIALAAPANASDGLFDKPPGARLNADKLARIGDYLKAEIAAGKLPGIVLHVEQGGRTVLSQSLGVQDAESRRPMSPDTIFRLQSLSKPITSVAAMMLVDQGRLTLDEPVSRTIPSFARIKVGAEVKAENGDPAFIFVAPNRPITVRDLLLHTSGITYGFYGDGLLRRTYGAANIYDGKFDNAEFAERIARLPLAEQPGTLWDYGHSTDVLGRVIEVATGKTLYDFEKEALLGPLGMTSTGFFLDDPINDPRLAKPAPGDDFRLGAEDSPDAAGQWQSGGGGMHSTLRDMARFARMLLNGGELEGRRYLSRDGFALMTTDQIGQGSGVARDYHYFPGDGFGFGFGLAVRTGPGNAKPPPPGSLGELKWDGAGGCTMVIDRKQDLFYVLLMQTPTNRQPIQRRVKELIYDALE